MKKDMVAKVMTKKVGTKIRPELVTRLPWDGTPGHMGVKRWDVYGARCGEFTLIAYVYDDDHINIKII